MSLLDDLVTMRNAADAARVYKLGAVPNGAKYPYAVISLAPNAPQVRTLDGSGNPLGRFVVQHFSRTHDGVSDLADMTFAAFDAQAIPAPGDPVAWQETATPVYRDADDDGVLLITHTYRY